MEHLASPERPKTPEEEVISTIHNLFEKFLPEGKDKESSIKEFVQAGSQTLLRPSAIAFRREKQDDLDIFEIMLNPDKRDVGAEDRIAIFYEIEALENATDLTELHSLPYYDLQFDGTSTKEITDASKSEMLQIWGQTLSDLGHLIEEKYQPDLTTNQ